MLHSVPVYAVMVEDLGERGAKYMALSLLQTDLRTTNPSAKSDPWANWTVSVTAGAVGASVVLILLSALKKLQH